MRADLQRVHSASKSPFPPNVSSSEALTGLIYEAQVRLPGKAQPGRPSWHHLKEEGPTDAWQLPFLSARLLYQNTGKRVEIWGGTRFEPSNEDLV